jgi:hypothetical protein
LRQRGLYPLSIDKIREALLRFETNNDNSHPVYARCQVHYAFLNVLQARNLADQPKTQDQISILHDQARESLNMAERIAVAGPYLRVLDRVHYFRAVLFLDLAEYGDRDRNIENASKEARRALMIAKRSQDRGIISHVLIIQSRMLPVHEGLRLAREAVDVADGRRVKTRALINLASLCVRPSIRDIPEARRLFVKASSSIKPSDGDYLRVEFEDLEIPNEDAVETIETTVEKAIEVGLVEWISRLETELIERVMRRNDNNISETATILQTSRRKVRAVVNAPPSTPRRPPQRATGSNERRKKAQ